MLRRFIRANTHLCRAFDLRFPGFTGTEHSGSELTRRVQRSLATHPARILEAGGIDRPMLGKSELYAYVGLDIDEKANCHEVYDELLVQSIESSVPGDHDLVISKPLLEHVADNRAGSEVPT